MDNKSDNLGVLVSCLCTIHCIATPVVSILVPNLANYFETELIHIGFLVFVLPLALYSFISQRKKHGSNLPLLLGGIGLGFLTLSLFMHELTHDSPKLEYTHYGVSIIGSIFLIIAHIKNIKLCRCHSCHDH